MDEMDSMGTTREFCVPSPECGSDMGFRKIKENMRDLICGLEAGFLAGGGRYTLRKVLGSGAASVVWLAVEHQLGQEVALKLFPAAICDSVFLSEIRRGVQKNRSLTHPNIVRIFDFV